jgi:hypothetical protein
MILARNVAGASASTTVDIGEKIEALLTRELQEQSQISATLWAQTQVILLKI